MAKRLLDLALAALVLALVSPLLLAAMLWVRVDSPGPVLFRQERVGRHGRPFRIHKLRTMHVDAPAVGPAITAHADARVTRAGHWLRRYRIDELPQLAGSPDPERAYLETILPRKLQRQVEYAERATWWSDLAVMARTLGVLLAR